MMPFLLKMKAFVSALVVVALATTLLFKENPLVVVAASQGPHRPQNVPTPPELSISKNVRSSVKAVVSGGWKSLRDDGHSRPDHNPLLVLAAPQPNGHVPTPSQKFNLHSSIEESAAGRSATRTPSPQCNGHVPTPECHHQKSRNEHQLHVLAAPQPNGHVPTPSKQFNVHSSIEESAAERSATRTPSPHCNVHVPTPGCRNQKSKEEEQLMVNGNAVVNGNGGRSATRTPSPQCNGHVPTPGCHHQKSKKEHQLHVLAAPQPNGHVPTPKQFSVDSSIEESAAARSAKRIPSPHCNVHVPTPGCRNQKSKEEEQLVVNRNADQASGDHINIEVGRGRFDHSLALHTQPMNSVRKLIAF